MGITGIWVSITKATWEEYACGMYDDSVEGIDSERVGYAGLMYESMVNRGVTYIAADEHPRTGSTIEALAKLKPIVRSGGTVTAGNASGINDGACALLIASGDAAGRLGLEPLARVVTWVAVGVEPRIMGIGPAPASEKVLSLAGLDISRMDVIELNEAFAAQGLATLRRLGVDDDAEHVNPNGGAIALGHPLGMSGARLVTTAAYELRRRNARYALCTMCIGVGQGIAMVIERP